MRLVLLDDSFTDIEEITYAEEVVKIKKYNEVGECKVKIGCDQDVVDTIRSVDYIIDYEHPDKYIMDNKSYMAYDMYKLTNISISTTVNQGDYLNVVAEDCLSMLRDRVVINPILNSGHPVDLLLALLKDCYAFGDTNNSRNLSSIIIDEASFKSLKDSHMDDTYDAGVDAENNLVDLLSRTLEICQAFDYGIKVRYCPDLNNGKFIISVYDGTRLEEVIFSPNFKNISETEYTETRGYYKNWARVKGASGKATFSSTEDTTPIIDVWLGDNPTPINPMGNEPRGGNRYETFIDAASNYSREFTVAQLNILFNTNGEIRSSSNRSFYYANGEYIAEMESSNDGNDNTIKGKLYDKYYVPLLKKYGIEYLKSLKSESSFSGELEVDNMYEYTEDYNLGDIVVAENTYKLGADNVRIVEIWESRDTSGVDILEPKFRWGF